MTTSIYLSNEAIRMVTGKVKRKKIVVQSFDTMPYGEGAMVNGVITGPNAILAALDKLTAHGAAIKGPVRLAIDSGSILMKVEEVPPFPPKKLLELTRQTFENVAGTYEDLLYDYAILRSKNPDNAGGTILCAALERSFIEAYLSLFEDAGIQVESIDLGIDCAIRMVRCIDLLAEKTYILSFLDGNTVLFLLFVQGEYRIVRRNRLLAERGTQAACGEIAEGISSLLQFHKSQKIPEPITAAYFCGLRNSELVALSDVKNGLHIEAEVLPKSPYVVAPSEIGEELFSLADYLFVTGNLTGKRGGRGAKRTRRKKETD